MPGPCRPTELSRPAVGLGQARGRPARPGLDHDRLGHDRADLGHVDVLGQLTAGAGAPGGGQDRVGQLDVAEPGPQINRHALWRVRRPARLPAGRTERVERDRAHVLPADQVGPEHRPVCAGADDAGDAVRARHRQHAAHAHPRAAGHGLLHQGLHGQVVAAGQAHHLTQYRQRGRRVDEVGAGLVDDLAEHAGDDTTGAERTILGGDGGAARGAAGPQRAEHPVRAGRAEHEVDLAAALAEPSASGNSAVLWCPTPTSRQLTGSRGSGNGRPSGPTTSSRSRLRRAASHWVPGPPVSKTNSIVPPWSARTSWMENARRSSIDDSGPPTAMVTNCPGRKSVAMAGATMVTAW